MILKIVGTILSRTFSSITGFILVMLTANLLGAEARGEIALVILGVSISGLFQSIVGASGLTYLLPKNNFRQLLTIALVWSVFAALLVNALMELTQVTPAGRFWFLTAMAIPQGIVFIAQSVLIAKKKIILYNRLEYVRSGILLAAIFTFFFSAHLAVETVFWAYIISNVLTALLGLIYMRAIKHKVPLEKSWGSMFKELFKYGYEIQLNNISQMVNYRFVYFLVEKWKGMEALGIFSVAVAIAETIWIIAKSIATYQTAQMVNSDNSIAKARLTVFFMKISFLASLVALVIVLLLPVNVYQWLFGEEFGAIAQLLPYLAPGILFLAVFAIVNHYFYAVNSNWINIRAAFLGNCITLVFGVTLIYYFDTAGAASVYSFTFFGMMVFLLIAFFKNSNATWKDLKFNMKDLKQLK